MYIIFIRALHTLLLHMARDKRHTSCHTTAVPMQSLIEQMLNVNGLILGNANKSARHDQQ